MASLRLRIVQSTRDPSELSLRLDDGSATATTLIYALKEAGFAAGDTALLITEDTMDVKQLADEAVSDLKREALDRHADAEALRKDIATVISGFMVVRGLVEREGFARDLANNLVEALRLNWDFARSVIR